MQQGGVRCDFADIRQRKQQEHAEKLADIEKRFTKRSEEDKYKQYVSIFKPWKVKK